MPTPLRPSSATPPLPTAFPKGGTLKQRTTRKQRQAMARLIHHLTDYAEDAAASNVPNESLFFILDQIHFPHDLALVKEVRWIFTRKVESGSISLRHQDPVRTLLSRYTALTTVQKVKFQELLKEQPPLPGDSSNASIPKHS